MTSKIFIASIVVAGLVISSSAFAAPPQKVTHRGTPVTSAVPGKPFVLKLHVKNTGTTTYENVSVIVHIPDGISHTTVSPANAEVVDDTITWSNVPLIGGQSFYPVLTLKLDAGTKLQTKKNIWVEVTGTDMEATSVNFSLTAVAAVKTAAATLTSADITAMFQTIYKRTPTASELAYWLSRRTDKPSRGALQGAMAYHKAQNIQH